MEAYLSTTEKLIIIFNLLVTEYIITTDNREELFRQPYH